MHQRILNFPFFVLSLNVLSPIIGGEAYEICCNSLTELQLGGSVNERRAQWHLPT
jgi:hypothetical protein